MDRFEVFATTIATLNRNVQKLKADKMAEFGLKGTHGMCIYALGKSRNGLTATQICNVVKEDKAAVSRAINELMQKGYVYTNFEDEDKRAYRNKIFLTEHGRAMLDDIYIRIDHVLDIGGEGLTDEQRATFYNALSIISDNLLKYMKTEK